MEDERRRAGHSRVLVFGLGAGMAGLAVGIAVGATLWRHPPVSDARLEGAHREVQSNRSRIPTDAADRDDDPRLRELKVLRRQVAELQSALSSSASEVADLRLASDRLTAERRELEASRAAAERRRRRYNAVMDGWPEDLGAPPDTLDIGLRLRIAELYSILEEGRDPGAVRQLYETYARGYEAFRQVQELCIRERVGENGETIRVYEPGTHATELRDAMRGIFESLAPLLSAKEREDLRVLLLPPDPGPGSRR